jgi:hypothetical protein
MTNTKLCVVISDIHAGSTYAPVPDNFITLEGTVIVKNPVQKWIMKCWDDCWEWLYKTAGKDGWDIIINGDLVHGTLFRTKEIWSNNIDDHVMACYNLLKTPAQKAEHVYIIQGTEAHVATYENTIGNLLEGKGVKIVRQSTECSVWDSLLIKYNDILCKVDHHIATTGRPYLEASALSIHMGAERVEAARAKHAVPQVFARAHRHKFGEFSDGYGTIFTSPPWIAKDRFARKVVPHAIPQIGMVLMDFRGLEKGELPLIRTRLHTIKQQKIV